MVPDQDIPVFYYRLKPETKQYSQALAIHEQVCAFVKAAQSYADLKGADNWRAERGLSADKKKNVEDDGFRLASLSYTDEKRVPDNWYMDKFGEYKPIPAAAKELDAIKVPTAPLVTDDGVVVRFHVFSDQIIIAAKPDQDDKRPLIANAEPLEDTDIEVIKLEASQEDMAGFALNRLHWSPLSAPLALHGRPLPEEKLNDIRAAENERFRQGRILGYIPNPTTGLRGLMRKLSI